jgi:hypothetical protein
MTSRRYEFRVAGWLSEGTRGAFSEMLVVDAPPETIIVGDVIDEAQLHGVLALMRNLGLHVVSLREVLGEAPTPPATAVRSAGPDPPPRAGS